MFQLAEYFEDGYSYLQWDFGRTQPLTALLQREQLSYFTVNFLITLRVLSKSHYSPIEGACLFKLMLLLIYVIVDPVAFFDSYIQQLATLINKLGLC